MTGADLPPAEEPLECNPNGQFAFIEYGTGQPIARTVADLLSRAEAEHATSRRRLLID